MMQVTDEMVQVALDTWDGLCAKAGTSRKDDMRLALTAALSVQPDRSAVLAEAEKVADQWSEPQELLLRCGEMTAQELRTAVAVAKGISAAIRALQDGPVAESGTPCERCQGNGELVIDWERYLEPTTDEKGDEAVTDCPDCDGVGRKVPAPAVDLEEVAKALEFYADVSKYPAPLTGGMGELWSDCGQVARAALARIRGADHDG